MARALACMLLALVAACANASGPPRAQPPLAGEPGSFTAHLNGHMGVFGGVSSVHP